MRKSFSGRDFLTLMDFTKKEVEHILAVAEDLKRRQTVGDVHRYLDGKIIVMIFEKPSTRTRISFQAGVAQLGGQAFYSRPDELQLGRGEPIRDTARVIDRYCDALVIRTFGQGIVEEFAEYMEKPVINALTDLTHPCQALADLLTIREKKGKIEGLKIVYAGDVWNVCHSLMIAGTMFGADIHVARPQGYEPNQKVLREAKKNAERAGSQLVLTHELGEALKEADVVYANTWHSMGGPEMEKEKRLRDFATYQISEQTFSLAKDDAIFMHCLPGYRGEEMTDEIIEGPSSVVFDQAENRLHTEKAVLTLVVE